MSTTSASKREPEVAPAQAPGAEVGASSPAGLRGNYEPPAVADPADVKGAELLALAQAKAPSLTAEFVKAMGIGDDELRDIARGLVPPPPTPGPLHTADMYRTPAGYQQTPPGVAPHEIPGPDGPHAGPISR